MKIILIFFLLLASCLRSYKINLKGVWSGTYEFLNLLPPTNCNTFYGDLLKRGLIQCTDIGEGLLYMSISLNGDLNMSFHNMHNTNFTCDDGITYRSDIMADMNQGIVDRNYFWSNASISAMCALKNASPKSEIIV